MDRQFNAHLKWVKLYELKKEAGYRILKDAIKGISKK
jgi:hypothetical protein